MSSKEKREKLEQNPEKWKKYLEKDAKRKKKERDAKKKSMTLLEQQAYRKSENERIRNLRLKNKVKVKNEPTAPDQSQERPYKSAQAMGKAVRRARNSLPTSPRKRRAVAAAVAKHAGLQVTLPFNQNRGRPALDDNVVKTAKDFYLKDDISWQAPGRKDVVSVAQKDDRGKTCRVAMQARYMFMSLAEAYKIFCEVEPDVQLSLSKFCDLRPKHVKLFDQINVPP